MFLVFCSNKDDKDDKSKIAASEKDNKVAEETKKTDVESTKDDKVQEEQIEEFQNIIVASIEGDVKWTMPKHKDNPDKWKTLRENKKLIKDAIIKTLDDSKVIINIDDNGNLLIDANSVVQLSRQLINSKETKGLDVNLEKGKVFSALEKLSKLSSLRVTTKTSTLGVRGTAFSVLYSDDSKETTIKVSQGTVEVTRNLSELQTNDKFSQYYDKITKPILVTSKKKMIIRQKENDAITKAYHSAITEDTDRYLIKINKVLGLKTEKLSKKELRNMHKMQKLIDPDFVMPAEKTARKTKARPKKRRGPLKYESMKSKPTDLSKKSQSDVEVITPPKKYESMKSKPTDLSKKSQSDVEVITPDKK